MLMQWQATSVSGSAGEYAPIAAVRAMARRLAAAPVTQDQRAGQRIAGDGEAADQLVLPLPQARRLGALRADLHLQHIMVAERPRRKSVPRVRK